MKSSILILSFLLLFGCTTKEKNSFPKPNKPFLTKSELGLNKEEFRDKILGLLVGSAIGDAMGAPVEMWYRNDIWRQTGWISGLVTHIRTTSAEGPWVSYSKPGGTTDDTRWKQLIANYIIRHKGKSENITGKSFAEYILFLHKENTENLKNSIQTNPDPFEEQLLYVNWLQEWAKVSTAYLSGDLDAFAEAQARFYGGEMVCGGMLYAPLLGCFFSEDALTAYNETFEVSIFDIGFGRDLSALHAAMSAQAMQKDSKMDEVLYISRRIDPKSYNLARLTGRIANRLVQDAKYMVSIANENPIQDAIVPSKFPYDKNEFLRFETVFRSLEAKNQDMPFHSSEIFLINQTALEFAQDSFMKAMEFVVNFGRDNDTVAAITGGILGAKLGFRQLPQDIAKQVINRNKQDLNIDLVDLANQLTEIKFGK
jgi:hypothetical protein